MDLFIIVSHPKDSWIFPPPPQIGTFQVAECWYLREKGEGKGRKGKQVSDATQWEKPVGNVIIPHFYLFFLIVIVIILEIFEYSFIFL